MQELYYINGSKPGYTWNQLLYWCWEGIEIGSSNRFYNIKERLKSYKRSNQNYINFFFKDFGHNPNDGCYRDGYWEQKVVKAFYHVVVGPMRSWEKHIQLARIYERVWVKPTFTPKKYQITDSYGRIIPSSLIRNAYLRYKPDYNDRLIIRRKIYKYNRWNSSHPYEFRKGPVPYTKKWKRGWKKRRTGKNRASRAAMKRQWFRDEIYSKEILFDYGITFKMDGKEIHHNHHRNSKGRGWKRTRKEKQWM